MTAGLTVYNDSGYVQIDETYKNLALTQKGTATTTTVATGVSGASKVSLTFSNCVSPVLFFRSGVEVSNMSMTVSGSTYTYQVQVNGAVGTTFDYYLFDEPVLQNIGAGLEVYNAAGQLVFESGQKYIRVVDFIKSLAPESFSSQDYTYTSGRTYAYGFATQGFRVIWVSPGPGSIPPGTVTVLLIGGISITNGVRLSRWTSHLESYTGTTGGDYLLRADVLVIDVTNF